MVTHVGRPGTGGGTELERFLEIFDRRRGWWRQSHLLEVGEDTFPQRWLGVFERLLRAGAEGWILNRMDLEDDMAGWWSRRGPQAPRTGG